MTVILYALLAMLCASLCFVVGATWAALPRLRERQPTSALKRVAPAHDADRMTLAR